MTDVKENYAHTSNTRECVVAASPRQKVGVAPFAFFRVPRVNTEAPGAAPPDSQSLIIDGRVPPNRNHVCARLGDLSGNERAPLLPIIHYYYSLRWFPADGVF